MCLNVLTDFIKFGEPLHFDAEHFKWFAKYIVNILFIFGGISFFQVIEFKFVKILPKTHTFSKILQFRLSFVSYRFNKNTVSRLSWQYFAEFLY